MEEMQKKQLERIKKITKVKIGEHELKLSDMKPLKYGEMKKLKASGDGRHAVSLIADLM